VQFLTSLSDLPATTKKRLALISGRTADNPKLMSEAIQVNQKAKHFIHNVQMHSLFNLKPNRVKVILISQILLFLSIEWLHLHLFGKTRCAHCGRIGRHAQ
jgi:hypothetical protein